MPEATAESPPAEMQNEQFATCHRERGNGLYKSGKLLEGNHLQLHLKAEGGLSYIVVEQLSTHIETRVPPRRRTHARFPT